MSSEELIESPHLHEVAGLVKQVARTEHRYLVFCGIGKDFFKLPSDYSVEGNILLHPVLWSLGAPVNV